MAFNAPATRQVVIPTNALRSTTPVVATIFQDITDSVDYEVEAISTLDQAGTIQLAFSYDGGTTFTNFGATLAVAATSNLTIPAMPSPKPFAGLLRVTFTASVIPTAGNIQVALHKRYM